MDLGQMIMIIEVYIHLRTDREVRIDPNQFKNGGAIISLHHAYQTANLWMQENKVQITKIN